MPENFTMYHDRRVSCLSATCSVATRPEHWSPFREPEPTEYEFHLYLTGLDQNEATFEIQGGGEFRMPVEAWINLGRPTSTVSRVSGNPS